MTTEPSPEVLRARAELTSTLDAIEDKLNLPKQAKRAARRTGERIRTLREDRPAAFTAAAVGATAAVGGAVWLAVRMLGRR